MGLRLTAVIPIVASVVSVVLSILLLASGSSVSSANDDFWLALNLSGIGGNLVEVQPTTPSSDDPLGGLINSIPGLGSVLDNITSSIGGGLSDLQGTILGNLTTALGVKDVYILYASKMCQGDFRNPSDPNSDVNVESCYTYRDGGAGLANISNSIPSGFTVGTAEVSVPLVATLKTSISSIVSLAVGAATAMQVLMIIGTVAAGLTVLGSVLGLVRAQSRLFVLFNLAVSQIAANILLVLAIVSTVVIAYGSSTINQLGTGLSIQVKQGSSFLAFIWVSAILSLIAGSYWLAVWFVAFRKSAFSRRSRTQSQIGNWTGIFGEVRRDLKLNGHSPTKRADDEGRLVGREKP